MDRTQTWLAYNWAWTESAEVEILAGVQQCCTIDSTTWIRRWRRKGGSVMIEMRAFNAVTWIAVRFGRLPYLPWPFRQVAHAVLVPWAKRLTAKGGADIVVTQSKNSA